MDAIEMLGAKFGKWYEGLFGGESSELHPKDVLRRITQAMEDGRREGIDGKVYVPNQFTLELTVSDADERDYLRSFLDEAELRAVLSRYLRQHNYATRGPLTFTVVDAPEGDTPPEKLRVRSRFVNSPAEAASSGEGKGSTGLPPAAQPAGAHSVPDDDPPTVFAAEDEADPLTVAVASYGSLVVTGTDGKTAPFPLNKPVVTIGRARTNDLPLPGDEQVSRAHAKLERGADGMWTVTDLGSTNGVLVGTVHAVPSRVLHSGETIWIGSTRLVFQLAENRPAPRPEILPQRALLTESGGKAHILASETLIGRAVTSDIVLADPSVSMRHARVVCPDPAQCFLEDVGSANGTVVNGQMLPPGERILLRGGDVLHLGDAALTFSIPRAEA